MRSLRSMLISGWVVLLLLATAGFAAYSTRGGADPAAAEPEAVAAPASLPAVSGRVSAFILAESLTPPPAVPADAEDSPGTTSSTTSTSTTSTTSTVPDETSTTSTTALASATTEVTTTTTSASTTTAAAPTTTTTQPATTTTAAPTTTTSEATTTTLPATGTTEVPEETTTTAAPRPTGGGAEQWRGLVAAYFPASLVDEALVVMQCESRGDPSARNPYSGAAGLFQFMPRTWSFASEGAGFAGADVYDAEANIAAAAWLVDYSLATGHGGGAWGHWNCKP